MPRSPACERRHVRLATVIVAVVVAVCGGTLGACYAVATAASRPVEALEARVRLVEQNDAANAARFEAIKDAIRELKEARR